MRGHLFSTFEAWSAGVITPLAPVIAWPVKDTFAAAVVVNESTVDWKDKLPSSTVFGITGDIDPTDPVKDIPVGIIIFVLTILTDPNEAENDTHQEEHKF